VRIVPSKESLMLKQRFVAVTVAMVLAMSAIATSEVAAQGNGSGTSLAVPIVGSGDGTTFAGTFNIQRFVRSRNQILASGTLIGVLTDTATGTTQTVIRQLRLPLDTTGGGGVSTDAISIAAVCSVLHLNLGPLDLNLLGLLVHLDPVVLNIDAESGAGNLVGNLLCAVAGLLDGGLPAGIPGLLAAVTNLLNQILGILG
jgi:hypothetical protein